MDERKLNLLIENEDELERRLRFYLDKRMLFRQKVVVSEVEGHFEKAGHNLNFVSSVSVDDFSDWVVTGCYYAVYHSALTLILSRGYFSKNHDATLCVLIKEFFVDVGEDGVRLVNRLFLDKEDLNFYVMSKEKREMASYSGNAIFEKGEVEDLVGMTREFVDKVGGILEL